MSSGPKLPFSESLHAEKYRGPGESFKEAMTRVASALQDDTAHFREIREILLEQRFLPGGRIQAAIGSLKRTTPYNCFVSGTIEDSFVEGEGSIMARAAQAAATMRMGGGIGYDFSTLRPRGATIRKLESRSSGPIAFMDIYDSICRCVASSGHRRGAQMGVLRVDHPDIEEFVHAKQNKTRLTGFNISIAVTDEFMRAVEAGTSFPLRWGREVFKEVDARALFEKIMRSTWDWAEPGVLFIDAINDRNNLYYCERIAATNPCGEQPLPPFGACLLGSFNLTKYVRKVGSQHSFDFDLFEGDVEPIVRAMDNVVDRAVYPLYEQEKEAKSKRRMGLGVTGLANAGEALGFPYGSKEFVAFEMSVLTMLRNAAYRASAEIAATKGSFPLFDRDRYLAGKFVAELPSEIRELIYRVGIRNSHLTSIAPTGTISLAADNVSSGIEPVFAYEVERTYVGPDGEERVALSDYGLREFGVRGRVASEVSVEEHLAVLVAAAGLVDSAVSKTMNVPHDTPWAEFGEIYKRAWKAGCKGCTTYTMGGKREGILAAKPEVAETSSCTFDPASGRKSCE